MSASANMKMVNSRVSAVSADAAASVLNGQGLTVSAFIRNSLEYVANTGEVPDSGFPARKQTATVEQLREALRSIESRPMPGRSGYSELDEDQLVERLMMERHGY